MTNKALRLPAVKELTSLSRSSIYRLVQLGRFPAPVKLSERASAWREADVTAWLESRSPAPVKLSERASAWRESDVTARLESRTHANATNAGGTQ